MKFLPTAIAGAFVIETEPRSDERGSFARVWEESEFKVKGLNTLWPQANASKSVKKGTIRGLHYQAAPHGEAKLVRCTAGKVFDVIVDTRKDSKTFGKWVGTELDPVSRRMVYVPEGCAHGYLAMEDNSECFYFASSPYFPEAERGVRYDDPKFKIEWPKVGAFILSEKDRAIADFPSL